MPRGMPSYLNKNKERAMPIKTAESCIAELARAPVPAGLVRVWIDDGQEGGWFENVTPARAAEIEAEDDRGI